MSNESKNSKKNQNTNENMKHYEKDAENSKANRYIMGIMLAFAATISTVLFIVFAYYGSRY